MEAVRESVSLLLPHGNNTFSLWSSRSSISTKPASTPAGTVRPLSCRELGQQHNNLLQATETRDVLEALVAKCREFEGSLLSEQMRCSTLEAAVKDANARREAVEELLESERARTAAQLRDCEERECDVEREKERLRRGRSEEAMMRWVREKGEMQKREKELVAEMGRLREMIQAMKDERDRERNEFEREAEGSRTARKRLEAEVEEMAQRLRAETESIKEQLLHHFEVMEREREAPAASASSTAAEDENNGAAQGRTDGHERASGAGRWLALEALLADGLRKCVNELALARGQLIGQATDLASEYRSAQAATRLGRELQELACVRDQFATEVAELESKMAAFTCACERERQTQAGVLDKAIQDRDTALALEAKHVRACDQQVLCVCVCVCVCVSICVCIRVPACVQSRCSKHGCRNCWTRG